VIRVSAEGPRGCGYRKVGGLYLVSDGPGVACGRLPLRVEHCRVCGAGIKPARGWTWINPQELFDEREPCEQPHCYLCPVSGPPERAGLIWIGRQHYKTPRDFTREAEQMGCSRRIVAVPKDFKLGETWVFLAHREAIVRLNAKDETVHLPGIFHIFRPSRIEQVVAHDAEDEDEEIQALRKRGIEPVIVQRLGEQGQLLMDEDE
jgi:hypothetical protein